MKQFTRLIAIVKKLRNPTHGCPWDLVQTPASLKEYILEETHELIEAINAGSCQKQIEELGDLLLQIVFLSRIHQELNNFDIKDVIKALTKKLISRHPHVFGNLNLTSPQQVKQNWEKLKKIEKKKKSIISDYPSHMPSLMVAKRISEQASSVGFDWNTASQALLKVQEEVEELKEEVKSKDHEKIAEELGDLFFALANVARLLNINPEFALQKSNKKFTRRFRFIEQEIYKRKLDINEVSLEDMENLWQEAKLTIENKRKEKN